MIFCNKHTDKQTLHHYIYINIITNSITIIPIFNLTIIISGKWEDDHHRHHFSNQAKGVPINKLFRMFRMRQ